MTHDGLLRQDIINEMFLWYDQELILSLPCGFLDLEDISMWHFEKLKIYTVNRILFGYETKHICK